MPRMEKHMTETLTPEALGYLKALRVAADDSCSSEGEANQIQRVFEAACARYGLDVKTMAAAIEVLL